MNTSINLTQEDSNTLLSLTNIYDKIDISEVEIINGTIASITAIIESGNFVGISSQINFALLGEVDDDDVNYLRSKTTGNIVQLPS
tara:strand:- start:386 stop:643 length:258 start_codon:yes stop_codon:yes gene_type:complete